METKYKYFIENLDTNEWYRNTIGLEPTIHTFGKGWDKPEPIRWTKDPLEALAFDKREDAATFLIKGLELRVGGNGYLVINWVEFIKESNQEHKRDIAKNLVITEHEFVPPKN